MPDLTKLNATQIVYRGILQQILPYLSDQQLDVLLSSIDQSITPPLNVDATNTPSLIVNVGPAIVSNSESNRNKSIPFINNVIPTFNGGTITFPTSDGGNIVCSPGSSVALTLPSGEYCKVLLSLDPSGNLEALAGVPAGSSSSAVLPVPNASALPFAYILLFNNSGTIQNVTQNNIFQLEGSGGGGGAGGVAQEISLTIGTVSQIVTFPTAQSSASYVIIPAITNTIDSLVEFIPVTIVNKTTTSFTAEWNAPLPSSNYKLDYLVGPGITEQVGEAIVNMGDTSATITIPLPMASVGYVVTPNLVNYTDPVPSFLPITVTNKALSSFTVKWNTPISTANYRVAWQIATFQ